VNIPTITYCFDKGGGFYAKSVSDAGVVIEYAYPSSVWADKARQNPAAVAELMLEDAYVTLAFYAMRPWYADRIARMDAQMKAVQS